MNAGIEPLFLTVAEVLQIHSEQLSLYGGPDGVRDASGLESAVTMPMATFGSEFLHPTIPAMAAAYLFHICQNHPFLDGNKRTGANAAITFLLMNDWEPEFGEDELVEVVVAVASGRTTKARLVSIFEGRCRPAEFGEREG